MLCYPSPPHENTTENTLDILHIFTYIVKWKTEQEYVWKCMVEQPIRPSFMFNLMKYDNRELVHHNFNKIGACRAVVWLAEDANIFLFSSSSI